MNSSVRIPRQQSTEQRRQQIVEAAADCFIDKGFYQTSMRDIAAQAEVSLGNLYNHFDSKQALILEIASLEAVELDEFESALVSDGSCIESILLFSASFLEFSTDPDNLALGVEVTAAATRDPEIAHAFAGNRAKISARIAACLQNGIVSKEIDSKVDSSEGAEHILDLVESCAYRTVLSGEKITRKTRNSLRYLISKYLSS